MREPNHICKTCGNEYYECDSCVKLQNQGIYAYRMFYDSPECFQISIIVANHRSGEISTEEAIEALKGFDLSKLNKNTDTKRYIDINLALAKEPVAVKAAPRKSRYKDSE